MAVTGCCDEKEVSRLFLSHDLARAFAAFLGAFAGFEDFVSFLGADFGTEDFEAQDFDARRAPGTFPILGSPARTSSQARNAASSKSCASAGRTCQPVTFFFNACLLNTLFLETCFINTWMDRMLGNSRRRLW